MKVEYRELYMEREGDPNSIVECLPVIYEVMSHEQNPARYDNPFLFPGDGDFLVKDNDGRLKSIPVCFCKIAKEKS